MRDKKTLLWDSESWGRVYGLSVNNLDCKKTPQADDEDEDEVFLLEHIFFEKK